MKPNSYVTSTSKQFKSFFNNQYQSLNEDARREYNDQMNEIGQISDKIRAKRIELAEAGEERQEELKKDLKKLENALKESVSKFKEEISEDK